jgi:tRNA(fMet)-specific endonuclease VapC
MLNLLDTNIWVALSKGEREATLRKRRLSPKQVRSCAIVWSELKSGAHKSARRRETVQGYDLLLEGFVSLPFDDEAGKAYGGTRAYLERTGTLIGHNDLQIAPIALSKDCVVATRNEREFRGVPGLLVEAWD